MTLTVVVGSSGSGKTTFLNDVHGRHKCIYIRQYHGMRPYIMVTDIPNFDPTRLPYWDIYKREATAQTIKVGGTMAGQFTAGLSGGQRKLLLFELICQRTADQSDLLVVLDEPFAGVTDDFVPFIVDRLTEMRTKHNVLLVTNDHIESLTSMADNTITVSAIDRTKVVVNDKLSVDRSVAIAALSVGERYNHTNASMTDLTFFYSVEVKFNTELLSTAAFTIFLFGLFLLTFWDSARESAALILIAGELITYFTVNPYLLSLVDWRNYMIEEAEALLHSSKGTYSTLKMMLAVGIIILLACLEYAFVNVVMDNDSLSSPSFLLAMMSDSASMSFPLVCLGIGSSLDLQSVQIIGVIPYLFMVFFSTTFSPGAGLPVFKDLRYLFARFYYWCMVPVVQDEMEGCPESSALNLALLVLSGLLGTFLFLAVVAVSKARKTRREKKLKGEFGRMVGMSEFRALQSELYGRDEAGGGADLHVKDEIVEVPTVAVDINTTAQ